MFGTMRNLVKEKAFYRTFFFLTFTIALRNVIVFTVIWGQRHARTVFEQALSGVALVNQDPVVLRAPDGHRDL